MEVKKMIKQAFASYLEDQTKEVSHLEDEALGLYLEHLLTGEAKDKVEEHLAGCTQCMELYLLLKEMESRSPRAAVSPPKPPGWQERLQEVLSPQNLFVKIKALKEGLEVLLTNGRVVPAAAHGLAVRGAVPGVLPPLVTVQKHFGSLQVEVEVEQVKGGEKELKVAMSHRWSKEPQKGLTVNLIRRERLLASYAARQGQVLFKHLDAGKYHVKIFDEQNEVVGMIILDIKGD